ncbi:SAM-dependent methyltransferase, partial [Streptomyces olivaceus]
MASLRSWVMNLDIGTGLPTEPNVHQVARALAPD